MESQVFNKSYWKSYKLMFIFLFWNSKKVMDKNGCKKQLSIEKLNGLIFKYLSTDKSWGKTKLTWYAKIVLDSTNLMKRQIQTNKATFLLSSWIIFDFKIKISGKNCVEKHPHIIVFMFASKINKFGRVWTEKIGIWRKKHFPKKS